MRTYRASGKAPAPGVLLVFLGAIIGGLLVGGLFGLVGHFFSLLILFPLMMGGASGYLLATCITKGKVRNGMIAILASLLTGVVTYGTTHLVDYAFFKHELKQAVGQELQGKPVSGALLGIIEDNYLQKRTHSTGIVGYMKLAAEEGVRIGRPGADLEKDGTPVQGSAAWYLWGIELVLCGLVAIAMGWRATNNPFCERCDEWYDKETRVAQVEFSLTDPLLNALKFGDFSAAKQLLATESVADFPRFDLFTQRCPHCEEADQVLTVKKVSLNRKKEVETKDVLTCLLAPAEVAILLQRDAPAVETTEATPVATLS